MIQNIKKDLQKLGVFGAITFLIYIILIIYISIHHEFSQDETQSWLIARDLNIIDIIKQMRYEGHSFLWHFLLVPFAKLGFPVSFQKIIPFLFSTATIYLILTRSPFSKLVKILIVFSSGMLYYYSAFARPYSMIVFFLVCIALIYPNKKKQPFLYAVLVGLLAHTHLIMLPTSILLVINFWVEELWFRKEQKSSEEKKKLLQSFFLVCFIILIVIIITLFGFFYCEIVIDYSKYPYLKQMIPYLIESTWEKMLSDFYGSTFVPIYYIVLLIFSFLLCIIGMKRNIKQGIIFFAQLLFMIFIHTFFWFSLPIRMIVIIYTLMFWAWIDHIEFKKENIFLTYGLILLIILTNYGTYQCINEDLKKKYSAGLETAQFIKKNIPKGSVFINTTNDFQQILSSYLNKNDYQFYLAYTKEFRTFNIWDESILIRSSSTLDVKNAINILKGTYRHIYILDPIVSKKPDFDFDSMKKFYTIKKIYKNKQSEMMNEFYVNDLVTFEIYEVLVRS